MSTIETVSVGQSGDVPLPTSLRQATGISAGSVVTLEVKDGTIVIRPVGQAEIYSTVRKAEFLLSNAVDKDDYRAACDEVRKLGLNPEEVPHHRPAGN